MIGFVGLTHLGIVYSLASASKVGSTLAYDPDVDLVSRLQRGHFPISEPGLMELSQQTQKTLRYITEVELLSHCSIVFFSLDVVTDEENRSDLGPLRQLMEKVLPHLPEAIPIILLSQVTPGFSRHFLHSPLGRNRLFFYQVETLIIGRAIARALAPERLIIGTADPQGDLPEVYRHWLEAFSCPVLPMRLESAELAKIAINLFLVSSLSMTNTIAGLCEKMGADWLEIADSLRLDARIGPHAYLSPGLGIAGGNLERDLVTFRGLANQHGTDGRLVEACSQLNRQRSEWALQQLMQRLEAHPKITTLTILGVAYKENTTSVKNSASLALQEALPHLQKQVYDPQVSDWERKAENTKTFPNWPSACQGAQVLLIMTPWPEFREISIPELSQQFSGKIIIDPHGLLAGKEARALGFDYTRMGSN